MHRLRRRPSEERRAHGSRHPHCRHFRCHRLRSRWTPARCQLIEPFPQPIRVSRRRSAPDRCLSGRPLFELHGSPRDKAWQQRPGTRRPRTRIPAVSRSGTTFRSLSAGAFTVCGHGCPRQLAAAGNQAKPALRSRTLSLASLVTGQCRRRPAPPSGCIRRPFRSRAGVPRRSEPFQSRTDCPSWSGMQRQRSRQNPEGRIRQPRARPFPGPIGAGQDRY